MSIAVVNLKTFLLLGQKLNYLCQEKHVTLLEIHKYILNYFLCENCRPQLQLKYGADNKINNLNIISLSKRVTFK